MATNQNEMEREFFNGVAEKWDSMCFHEPEKLEVLFSLLQVKPGYRVMDVGCGTGVLLPKISELVGGTGEVVAVDFAEKMLSIAREKNQFKNLKFFCEDVSCLVFKKNFFDLIICYSVFPHFTNPENTLKHLAKSVKVGGRLAVCHSESRDSINKGHVSKKGKVVAKDILMPAEQLRELMLNSGMKIIHSIDNEEIYFVMGEKVSTDSV
jgi:demethylmenaquinone methyltransferase/2-methoxy-6-polyprenyl-1,4-benzoquinol methylase